MDDFPNKRVGVAGVFWGIVFGIVVVMSFTDRQGFIWSEMSVTFIWFFRVAGSVLALFFVNSGLQDLTGKRIIDLFRKRF